jgi:catechol 2,3-dioxygenase-like lactoylglutathione lyase family enzyme
MTKNIRVQHVAVECCSQQHADRFFSSVLGLRKVKSTILSKEVSMAIFKIDKEVKFDFYDDGKTRFEVFINDEQRELSYAHTCIEVENKNDFMSQCKEQGLEPFFVEKGGKQLLFVRDFSGNLFEVLESNLYS